MSLFVCRKKVKMTDKPKRPMSAYMLWLNSAREQIKSENPGMKVTDIAKKGGEIWKSMKDKTVRTYTISSPYALSLSLMCFC